MPVKLTYSDFFENKNNIVFGKLLYESLKYKKSLTLSLMEKDVAISIGSPDISHNTISLTGKWRSPLLEGEYRETGALLLAPLFFNIKELALPHNCIYTLGKSYRSIADFFMRNLFYAAIRRELFRFDSRNNTLDAKVLNNISQFTRRYLWILKANLKEPIFETENVSELLLLSAHLPVVKFTQLVLDYGILEYQSQADKKSINHNHNMQIKNLIHIREKLLKSI